MKKLITLFLSAFLFTGWQAVKAQNVQEGGPGMWPAYVQFPAGSTSFTPGVLPLRDAGGKQTLLTNGKLSRQETDHSGMKHYRYQQYYNNIQVENAVLIIHTRQAKMASENGRWVKDFPSDLPAGPALSQANALQAALLYVGAKKYKWELPEEEAFLKREQGNTNASFYPKAGLVYYSGEADLVPANLRLAYKFDIYAQDPVSRQLVFVDAMNGRILGKRELIHETNAPGTAQTAYSGTQSITSDFTGTNYRLRETGRGNGINTYNLQTGTSYAAAVDFTDSDNDWNNVNTALDQYATDAHWATEKTYDYYFSKFGRNSIDNAGMALNSYVHYSTGYFNAFWDGSRMTYGDGNATDGNKPLTSLDVCGHEITHGVTERTSALIYSNESGAMNEGFSDIFGTAIEAFARPTNNDWILGGDFYSIRSMSDPNAFNQPDTYLGTNWYAGTGDNGGVHTNSGVLNYWFYLLTTGGSGTNDHGVIYNVTGIGMDKAAAIAYRLNTLYLVPTSEYFDARILGIQAAEDLYGIGSNEAIQTANAWTAVGLYGVTCGPVTGMNVSPLEDVTATLNWDAMPGASYYKLQYKTAASSTWINAGTVTGNSKVLTGLTASTLYDWRVRASCNDTYASAQFTTAAPICNPPGGMNALATGTAAELSWSAAPYAQSYVLEYKAAADNVWTVAATTTQRVFTINGLALNTVYDWRVKTNCSFGISNYGQGQFTTASTACDAPTGITYNYTNNESNFSWNAVAGATEYVAEINWAGANWPGVYSQTTTSNSISISNLMQSAGFQIRIRSNCGGNNSLWSNTFLFTTPCSAPLSPATSAITTTSATFNWVAPAGNANITAYSVAYRLANTGNAWTVLSNTNATSVTVNGLMPGMQYEWRVFRVCSYFNSGSLTTSFTTLGTPCGTPANLNSSAITGSQATVSWGAVSGAVTYAVDYRVAGTTSWISAGTTATANKIITGLSANTLYDWRVKTNCSANYSYYVNAQFTTSTTSGCAVPVGLNVTNLGNTTATLNWTAVSGATNYNVYYKLSTSTTWNSITATTNSYNLTALAMNAQYQFQVRTKCGTVYTAFSIPASFTTLSCVSYGNNSAQWIDLFTIGSINRVSGADPGGYVNTGLSTNLVIGSVNNPAIISMGFSGAAQKHNFCVYIDTNRNNIFEDAERFAGASLINTNGNVSFSISIPATATPGPTKMRVVVRKNTDGAPGPCLTGFVGETEDYNVNLMSNAFSFGGVETGIQARSAQSISRLLAHPNPSGGRFVVDCPAGFDVASYTVLNSDGKPVASGRMVAVKQLVIDITNRPAGIYLLRMIDNNGKTEVLKLIKN